MSDADLLDIQPPTPHLASAVGRKNLKSEPVKRLRARLPKGNNRSGWGEILITSSLSNEKAHFEIGRRFELGRNLCFPM